MILLKQLENSQVAAPLKLHISWETYTVFVLNGAWKGTLSSP